MTNKIISFKAFDLDLKCRGFQFKVGKEYSEKGEISSCINGFHACENPFDVLDFYSLVGSRFCEVEQSGKIDKADKKIASEKITIKAEINLDGFIKACFEYINFSEKDNNIDIPIHFRFDFMPNWKIPTIVAASGEDSVIVSSGINSRAKGCKGTLICLTHFVYGKPNKFTTGKIGENGLKENVFYKLDKSGEFVEY